MLCVIEAKRYLRFMAIREHFAKPPSIGLLHSFVYIVNWDVSISLKGQIYRWHITRGQEYCGTIKFDA